MVLRVQCLILLFLLSNTHVYANDFRNIVQVSGEFQVVKDFLVEAISDKGLKVNAIANIRAMLDHTQQALGATEKIYTHAEIVEFCSASLSRDMMSINPHNIVICPYRIAIYELSQQPGVIYLGYHFSPVSADDSSFAILQKVKQLLADIVAQTVE